MLRFSLLTLVLAACATDPDPKPTATPKAAAGDDLHASCVALMTKSRECTDVYIPALVDARASVDHPAGIADAVKQDRDGVIARAKAEWATDSTDANIDQHCSAMTANLTEQQKADLQPARDCLAQSACDAFVQCTMPIFTKHLGK